MIRLTIALVFLALPSWADPVSLGRLSAYINALTTAETRFTQYNADGTTSTGMLYIKRPGRMKFAYDPPDEALVLANAGIVAIFDGKSNAEPQQFPLKRTPLNLILGRSVDLTTAQMVSDHYETADGLTVVIARDPKDTQSGTIELFFRPDPIELVHWIITDETGSKTAVALDPLKRGEDYSSGFFSVNGEIARRGG